MKAELTFGADEAGGDRRDQTIAWIIRFVMPNEPGLRAWLRRHLHSASDVDDIVQEAYAKLAGMSSVAHVDNPRGYFFRVAHNLVTDHLRREKIVRIEAAAGLERIPDADSNTPERIVGGRRELNDVLGLIEALPDRCRQVVRMRKIDGLPQREIARRMGVSESVVENDCVKGLRLIMRALAEGDRGSDGQGERSGGRTTAR